MIGRARGMEKAEYFVNIILNSLPIQKIANALSDVLEAARIKARCAIAYADCFAVATALREGAPIVTGDPEFKKVEDIVQVHSVRERIRERLFLSLSEFLNHMMREEKSQNYGCENPP